MIKARPSKMQELYNNHFDHLPTLSCKALTLARDFILHTLMEDKLRKTLTDLGQKLRSK